MTNLLKVLSPLSNLRVSEYGNEDFQGMNGEVMTKVFISHSHRDAKLAEAFQNFIDDFTSSRLELKRSSKEGSIEYGNNWIDWIHDQVVTARITFILLTPSSFSAKWVLWEAGAVEGVRRVADPETSQHRRVIPILFNIVDEDMGPFQATQITKGLNPESLKAMASQVLRDLRGNPIEDTKVDEALMALEGTCRNFVVEAAKCLEKLQISQREDLVLEWVSRIERAITKQNYMLAYSLRRWINLAFFGSGRGDEQEIPIDFRIHSRLAEAFQKTGKRDGWKQAKSQLELAKRLSPRDMMLLRELARVELELDNTGRATELLEEMKRFDDGILKADDEALNLQVRILIQSDNWPGAHELLSKATELAKRSGYVANMRAIVAVKVRKIDEARSYFKELRKFEVDGTGIWSKANLLNAALGLGDTVAADRLIDELRASTEAVENWNSISRYFDEIIAAQPNFQYDWRARWKGDGD